MMIESREEANSIEEAKMPPDIVQTKSDELTDALRRLASISSNYHPQGKALQSSLFDRVREGQSIRVGNDDGNDDDDLSSPTVSCCESLTDDDFSLESTDELLKTGKEHPPLAIMDSSSTDGISISSINTVALRRIDDLKKKLEIQENTKLELLNQCMRLETELEKKDSNAAMAKMLKEENAELREQNVATEKNLMSEINQLMKKMEENERHFKQQLREKDRKIDQLEEDIQMLQIAKNIDPPSEIAVPNRYLSGIKRLGKNLNIGGNSRR